MMTGTRLGKTPLTMRSSQFQQLAIMCNMPNVKVNAFNKMMPAFPGLRQLELSKFSSSLGEEGLIRLLASCKRTLQYLALPYTTKAVSTSVLNHVSHMPKLTSFIMGHATDDIDITVSNTKLPQLKRLFK